MALEGTRDWKSQSLPPSSAGPYLDGSSYGPSCHTMADSLIVCELTSLVLGGGNTAFEIRQTWIFISLLLLNTSTSLSRYSLPLRTTFPICEMGVMTPTSQGYCRNYHERKWWVSRACPNSGLVPGCPFLSHFS